MLAQISLARLHHRRIELPHQIFEEASSINFQRSMKYGFRLPRYRVENSAWAAWPGLAFCLSVEASLPVGQQ